MMNVVYLPFFIVGFILSLFFAFYIPGIVVTRSDRLSGLAKHVIALVVGMVLWGWQGYIFGFLGIRWATYVYIFIFITYFYKNFSITKFLYEFKAVKLHKIDWLFVLLLIIGVVVQTCYYWKFGFLTREGINHVSYNVFDHYWHASMISELVERFPPFEPGMYGIFKTNYHYWFNLITAELIRVFYLPPLVTQALGMYTFGSLLLGLVLYILGKSLIPSIAITRWLLIFFYYASDISSLIIFIREKKLDFYVPSLIEDGSNFMDNPPRAFSIIIGLSAIYLLFKYVDKKYTNIFILGLLFGTLVGFKVYTAIGFVFGLGVLTMYDLLVKRNYKTLLLMGITVLLSIVIFFPVNGNSGGMFFLPFEKARDFITYKPLGFYDMELRWRIFQADHNTLRILHLGFIMTCIYLVIQFGVKLLGLIPYKKTIELLGKEKVLFLTSIIGISFTLGTCMSLKANPSESYNFYLPATVMLSILASLSISMFLNNKSRIVSIIIILLVISLSSPRWFYRVTHDVPMTYTEFSGISHDELSSYLFLKNNVASKDTVLVLNKGEKDSLYAIVRVYSGRHMYLSGQKVSVAHNTTNMERIAVLEKIYYSKNPEEIASLLKNNTISYLYFYGKPNLSVALTQINGKVIFSNASATIVKIQ